MHCVFEHGGTASVFGDKLDELFEDTLQVLVCLVPDQAVGIQVDKQLHPFTLG